MRENNKLQSIFEIYSSKNTAEKQKGKQLGGIICNAHNGQRTG